MSGQEGGQGPGCCSRESPLRLLCSIRSLLALGERAEMLVKREGVADRATAGDGGGPRDGADSADRLPPPLLFAGYSAGELAPASCAG